jgi:hypothetical protein
MSYQLKILKDHPIGFWPLDETSGSIATDVSGCNNNGIYTGEFRQNIFPLVSGMGSSTRISGDSYITYSILNDYQGTTKASGFGTQYSSDNDFTLEFWYYDLGFDNDYQLLFGDMNNLGVMANEKNIEFFIEDTSIVYTIPNPRKNTHVVATYHPDQICLYINGELAVTKNLSNFKFQSTSFTMQSIANGEGSFLIDSPAVYRYSLSPNVIKEHYLENKSLEPIHIVTPDEGSLIEFWDNNLYTKFKYIYPTNKNWQDFIVDGLVYNSDTSSLMLNYNSDGGANEVSIIDHITIPIDIYNICSINKIEWLSSKGISVAVSTDGESYIDCENGKTNQITSNDFYIKITFTSTNISRYLPSIKNLAIKFISSDLTIYSKNTGMYAENFISAAILDKLPTMNWDQFNGVRCTQDGTFDLKENFEVKAIEFLYTPENITRTIVDSLPAGDIYVNGILSSGTNMSDIFYGRTLHHVVINTQGLTDLSNFNPAGNPALFQNIALYSQNLNQTQITNHYNLYTGKPSISIEEPSFSMTETGFYTYNNNWTVIQNS